MPAISTREFLRNICSVFGITQGALSERMGMGPGYIKGHSGRGSKVRLDTAVKAVQAMGMDLAIVDKDLNVKSVLMNEDE